MGPDLTHLASRMTIAAGTLPKQRAAPWRVGFWIRNRIKPGNHMPPNPLEAGDLKLC